MLCFALNGPASARLATVCAITILAVTAGCSSPSWPTAHGNPDNGGTADVLTAVARTPLANVGLGDLAPGAGPVIAPDGTVYVGNMRGVLMSFQPDGTPGWSRDIGGFQSIMSSPALGSDGSVYVIGSALVRDHTTTAPAVMRVAELHKFTAGGGWLWHRPLPDAADVSLLIGAPPNILRAGGRDVVLLPTRLDYNVFLTAFSGDTGAVLAHQRFSIEAPEISGGTNWHDLACLLLACFSNTAPIPEQHRLPVQLKRPFPGVAIHTPRAGGTPLILMSDGLHDVTGLHFTGNAFEERFRIHDDTRVLISTPHAWPDGHVMISASARDQGAEVLYGGVGFSTIRAAGPFTYAAPTALGSSRHALVHVHGGVTVMSGVTIQTQIMLPGQSIASAAASRNHVFVSTASGFYTFDKQTMAQLAEVSWTKGGVSQPVIGPQGHVYAIARGNLYVFPPPLNVLSDGRLPDPGSPVIESTRSRPQPSGDALASAGPAHAP